MYVNTFVLYFHSFQVMLQLNLIDGEVANLKLLLEEVNFLLQLIEICHDD